MSWTRGHKIGQGSTAAVYLAKPNTAGEQPFAVKSAELSQSEFLRREQSILCSLNSPYIIQYRGSEITTEEHGKAIYNLKLEYMPGGAIADGRIEESVIGFHTWRVLKALEYLHANGIAHCDVKGSNILAGPAGAKLADFGCSKRVGSEEDGGEGPVRGTPMFMAPEAARGEEQGFAGDVWGLGCAVIEMATGGGMPWPEDGGDPVSVMYRVGYGNRVPEFPGRMSEQGRDFLEKCLRRDPRRRWTARELLGHPFVAKFADVDDCNRCFGSPTSVMDFGFWNSVEESENLGSLDSEEAATTSFYSSSEGEEVEEGRRRIGRLATAGPVWDDDEDDCGRWITVRESLESDYCVISDKSGGLTSLEGCKYGRVDSFEVVNCNLEHERVELGHDVLFLLPSLPIIVSQG